MRAARGRPPTATPDGRRPRAASLQAAPAPDAANRALFGRAGGYSAAGELPFCGFACAAGVRGNGRLCGKGRPVLFQAKTSAPAGSRRSFFASPGAHKEFDRPGAYCALVMRSDARDDFVMPYRDIQKRTEPGRREAGPQVPRLVRPGGQDDARRRRRGAPPARAAGGLMRFRGFAEYRADPRRRQVQQVDSPISFILAFSPAMSSLGPFIRLQEEQSSWRFSSVSGPPLALGTT